MVHGDDLTPVRHLTRPVLFNSLKLEREAPTDLELVTAMLVEASDFLDLQLLVVLRKSGVYLINGDLFSEEVGLAVVGILLHLDLDVEDRTLSMRCPLQKRVLIDVNLGTPRRWHVQRLCQVLQLVLLVVQLSDLCGVQAYVDLVIQIVHLFVFIVAEQLIVEHHVLPCHGLVQLELDVLDAVLRLHVDPEVGVVEDGVHQQVRAALSVVDAAG